MARIGRRWNVEIRLLGYHEGPGADGSTRRHVTLERMGTDVDGALRVLDEALEAMLLPEPLDELEVMADDVEDDYAELAEPEYGDDEVEEEPPAKPDRKELIRTAAKRKQTCGKCGQAGHNRLTCPELEP